MVWNETNLSDLKTISPNLGGSLEAMLPLISQATGTKALALKVWAVAQMDGPNNSKIKRTIQTSPIILVFHSDASLQSEARYFSEEGALLGSGPLPPQVGKATSYHVIWSLHKTTHTLKDISVSVTLPRSVGFVRVATSTAGDLVYDQKTRTTIWTLNRMPVGVNDLQAEFVVSLTPLSTDDGRFADLLGSSTMQATDEDTQASVSLTSDALTTDLQNDDGAKGKGVVRK